FDYFRQAYTRTGDSRPFLGYMNFYLLDRILSDFQRPFWGENSRGFSLPLSYQKAILDFTERSTHKGPIDLNDIAALKSLVGSIQEEFRTTIEIGEPAAGVLAPVCSIQNTLSLLVEFAELIDRIHGHRRLALLLDGIDYLGNLGKVLAPLLSKDEPHSERLVTKAACRLLPRYFYANS